MNHRVKLETSASSISGWYLSQNLKTVPGNINLGAKESFPRDIPRTTTQTSNSTVILDHQRTMTTRFAILLLAALSAAVMAAPGMIEPAHAVVHRSTPTTCATGAAASVSGYVLNYTAVEDTAAGNRFYDIEPGFSTDHSVGSAMVSHTTAPSHSPFPVSLVPRLGADGFAKRSRTCTWRMATTRTRTPPSSASSRATGRQGASPSSGGSSR